MSADDFNYGFYGSSVDPKAECIQLPRSMKMLSEDGTVTERKIGLPKAIRPCCGFCKRPDLGWYGPFGALRLLALLLTVLSWFCFALAVAQLVFLQFLGMSFSLWLSAGCYLGGLSAFSHEGLSDEVSKMAEQNDRFAENNERLQQQLDELVDVRRMLEEHEAGIRDDTQHFTEFVNRFHKVNSMGQLTELLEAYFQADSLYGGDGNKTLEGREVAEFFGAAEPILCEAFPTRDIPRMRSLAIHKGFDLWGVRILAVAVVHAENWKLSNAQLALVMFSLDGNLEKCADDVTVALEDHYEHCEIVEFLRKYREESGGGLVPRSVLVKLSKEITKHDKQANVASASVFGI
jgi:hypothetical protein